MKESFYAALLVLPAPSTETGSLAAAATERDFTLLFFHELFPSFLSRFLWLSFHLLLKLSCAQNE